MPISAPSTLSPGHLVLFYDKGGVEHTMSTRIHEGIDLFNLVVLGGTAATWAATMRLVLPGGTFMTDYGVKDNTGRLLYRTELSASYEGAAGEANPSWFSSTLTAVGTGLVLSENTARGRAIFRWHIWGMVNPDAGRKFYTSATIAALGDLKDFLDHNAVMFSDFYGQSCACQNNFPFQFNAFVQKRQGT